MAGYDGFSMSNNAREAYSLGEKPLSKWTKAEILKAASMASEESGIEINLELLKKVNVEQLRAELLIKSSWHHTSNYHNKTIFYELDQDALSDLTPAKIKEMTFAKKEKAVPSEERWECSYLEWSGTRKHPKAEEKTAIGVIKNGRFYLSDGSYKSTKANGFAYIKKIKES